MMSYPSKQITVLGNGGWGTAIAVLLSEAGHAVSVWGHDEREMQAIRDAGENEPYLKAVRLPDGITWTSQRAAVEAAEIVVLAMPSKFYGSVLRSFRGLIPDTCEVVSVSKGFDPETRLRLSATAETILGRVDVAALSGPSHAEEVARGIPSAVVLASREPDHAAGLQEVFNTERFRVYSSDDVIGVELGGALKNVIAVAVGISDGLGFGDNTRAALISRGLAEMMRLGCALGAKPETFSGLSGLGDLVVTSTSRHSRNRSVGERLGKGETMLEIAAGMKQVAEGVDNCDIALSLAAERSVEVPITQAVHNVIHGDVSPSDAVSRLMMREAKSETT
jgi:glycerol-3-phosphate dehydrogenase (NAD(P)+)